MNKEDLDSRLDSVCSHRFSLGYEGDEGRLISEINSLLEEGADPFTPTSWSKRPIIAEYCKHPKILDTFLNHIKDPNTPIDTDGNTLAHYITDVARSHFGCTSETIDECLQVFVEHGGDLSRLNNHNKNILFAPSSCLSSEARKIALESGCDPMQKNKDGISPLDLEFKENLRFHDLTNIYLYVKHGAELSDTQKEMLFGKNVPENIVQGLEVLKDKSIKDKQLRDLRRKADFRNYHIDPLQRKADVLKENNMTNKDIDPVDRYKKATYEVKTDKNLINELTNESEDATIMKELFNYQQRKNDGR